MWPSSGCVSVMRPLMQPPHQVEPAGGEISPLLFKIQFSLLSTLSGVFESLGIFIMSEKAHSWLCGQVCHDALSLSLFGAMESAVVIFLQQPTSARLPLRAYKDGEPPPTPPHPVQTIPLLSQRGQPCNNPGWPSLTRADWDWGAATHSGTFLKTAVSVPAELQHLSWPCMMETAAESHCFSRNRQRQRNKSI